MIPANVQKPVNRALTFYLYLFMGIHLFFWTLLPSLVRYNLPMDALEGAMWGHQLEWGYDKNPFLNGWLTALATYLSHDSGWVIYLFSQLSVIICFLATFKLVKQMVNPSYALFAVLLLEAIQYFNFHAIDFSDNILELSLWSLIILYFYQALKTPNYRYCILTGFFAALGLMAKYYTALLLFPLLIFLFREGEVRKIFSTYPPYVGLLVFFLMIAPHFIWLFFHDFVTITYAFTRVSNIPSWKNHLLYPLLFTWQQFEVLIPGIIIFLLFTFRKQRDETIKINRFDLTFLLYVSIGPFLITLLLSLIFGFTLRAGWGMPLLTLFGIFLLLIKKPHLDKKTLQNLWLTIMGLMAGLLISYTLSLARSDTTTSANFPGKAIAEAMTNAWETKYHEPLYYIAGSRWLSSNISFYSKYHPAVFIEWKSNYSPWIDLTNLKKRGAIFVWYLSNNEKLPNEIREAFPTLTPPQTLVFDWHRNTKNLPPIKIAFSFLPPNEQSAEKREA